jgi:predicted XRE-type DNA-binding protein
MAVGSANIFADLGVADPDLALAKVQLAERIAVVIRQRRLTQALAAEQLGIDQPTLSAIVRGRVREFTVDRLLRLLARLGRPVTFRFSDVADEASTAATPAKSTTKKRSRRQQTA